MVERKYLNSTIGTLLNVLLKRRTKTKKDSSNVTIDQSHNQLANHKLFNKSVNFGLKRIKLALILENPEKKLKNVISVAGGLENIQHYYFKIFYRS